jgi:uncharacterized membrane protein
LVGWGDISVPFVYASIIGGKEDGFCVDVWGATADTLPVMPDAGFCKAGFMTGKEAAAKALRAARSSFELLRVLWEGIRNLLPQYGQIPLLPA